MDSTGVVSGSFAADAVASKLPATDCASMIACCRQPQLVFGQIAEAGNSALNLSGSIPNVRWQPLSLQAQYISCDRNLAATASDSDPHLTPAVIHCDDALQAAPRNRLMKTSLIGLLARLSATAVGAVELADLAPCRPAAAHSARYTGGMTWNNLLRCGSTLATHSFHIGNACRDVLKRYGQL